MRQKTNPKRFTASRPWSHRWRDFVDSHVAWWSERSNRRQPVYCLHTSIIDALCDSGCTYTGRQRPRYLKESDEQNERDFLALCKEWDERTVGVSTDGEVLVYGFASAVAATWRPPKFRSPNKVDRLFDVGKAHFNAVLQSQMVHVAWLIQQPDYWDELKALREKFHDVREEFAFQEISGRLVPPDTWALEAMAGRIQSRDASDFLIVLWSFVERWEIAGLLSWDLPIPRGPHTLLPEESAHPTCLRRYYAHSLPSFLPESRVHGDRKTVWQTPRCRLRGPGNELMTQVGWKGVRPHANVLQGFLAERGVRDRFGGELPRGCKERLTKGLADQLEKDVDRVKRLLRSVQPAF